MSKTTVTFNLKCILCGHKESRDIPAGEKEGPACSKCMGPMVVEKVTTRS